MATMPWVESWLIGVVEVATGLVVRAVLLAIAIELVGEAESAAVVDPVDAREVEPDPIHDAGGEEVGVLSVDIVVDWTASSVVSIHIVH